MIQILHVKHPLSDGSACGAASGESWGIYIREESEVETFMETFGPRGVKLCLACPEAVKDAKRESRKRTQRRKSSASTPKTKKSEE